MIKHTHTTGKLRLTDICVLGYRVGGDGGVGSVRAGPDKEEWDGGWLERVD